MPNNPLPSTGNTISFNDIRIELGVGSASPFDIESAASDGYSTIQHCSSPWPDSGSAQGTAPHSLSEWWSYNHSLKAGQFLVGDDSTNNCAEACAGTPPFNCFDSIYTYSSKYYFDENCRLPYSGFIVGPTNCSSGTKVGQTCYEISSGTLISESTCSDEICSCLGGYCSNACPNPNLPCINDLGCVSE